MPACLRPRGTLAIGVKNKGRTPHVSRVQGRVANYFDPLSLRRVTARSIDQEQRELKFCETIGLKSLASHKEKTAKQRAVCFVLAGSLVYQTGLK